MTSPGVPFSINFWATSTETAALPAWLFRYEFRYTFRATAAMIAAITPSKIVPCRVVNSLLDMMFSTFFLLFLVYRTSAGTQLTGSMLLVLHGLPSGWPPTSSSLIQWPQIAPFCDSFPLPGNVSLFGAPPVPHLG